MAAGDVPGTALRFGSQCRTRLPLSAAGRAAMTFGPPSTVANSPPGVAVEHEDHRLAGRDLARQGGLKFRRRRGAEIFRHRLHVASRQHRLAGVLDDERIAEVLQLGQQVVRAFRRQNASVALHQLGVDLALRPARCGGTEQRERHGDSPPRPRRRGWRVHRASPWPPWACIARMHRATAPSPVAIASPEGRVFLPGYGHAHGGEREPRRSSGSLREQKLATFWLRCMRPGTLHFPGFSLVSPLSTAVSRPLKGWLDVALHWTS